MKRILFIVIPERGHINPMIGPASYLQRRGHVVAFFSMADISGQIQRAGLACLAAASPPSAPPDVNRGETFARQVRDRAWLRGWIKSLLIDAAPAQVKPIREAIRTFAPDLIVTDPMIYAAAIAAIFENVPWVAASNSLNPLLDGSVSSDLLDTISALAPQRNALFDRHGLQLEFRGCDMLSPRLTIAFTTPEFIGRTCEGVEMVGPSLPPGPRGDETDFPWEKLRVDRPLIYVSFGSQIYHQPAIFRLLMDATRAMGVQVLIVANELHRTGALEPLPEHVITCHYAPQLEILPRASAFVTHGGANSVMEALRFGVPLLLSSVCNDQFHQAHFLRRSGAGLVLDLDTATPRQCEAALRDLLTNEELRASLNRITTSYQRDGAARAADLIEEHAR
jgi:MGT family glycosyltransferase